MDESKVSDLTSKLVPPGLFTVGGVAFPNELMSRESLDRVQEMPMHHEDVVVAAYPKSGTVWTGTTVAAILASDDLDRFVKEGTQHLRVPLEYDLAYNVVSKADRPTIFHTHMTYELLPREAETKQVKVINVMRNPKDVAVSFYHHLNFNTMFNYYAKSWDEFFENYITGNVPHGSWVYFNTQWAKELHRPNVLHFTYEDYIADPPKIIRRLANFLNKELTDETIQKVAEITTIDSMQNNEKLDMKHPNFDPSKGRFLRKGKVGDWKNYLSEEQNLRVDRLYEQFVKDSGIELTFD